MALRRQQPHAAGTVGIARTISVAAGLILQHKGGLFLGAAGQN